MESPCKSNTGITGAASVFVLLLVNTHVGVVCTGHSRGRGLRGTDYILDHWTVTESLYMYSVFTYVCYKTVKNIF